MRQCAKTLAAEMTIAEHHLLISSLLSLNGHRPHLEIGTAAGGTLCAMLSAIPADTRPPFVVVDPLKYFPNQLETVHRNLIEHRIDPSTVEFRAMKSVKALRESERRGEQFDFILVDGCHKIQSVTSDLKWSRQLAVGGLICFHDYLPIYPGVKMSVDRFLRKHKNYTIAGHADSLLVMRKISPSPSLEIDMSDELFARFWSLSHRVARKWKRWKRAA